MDATLKFWKVQENYGFDDSILAHLQTINHIDFSQDGKHFVT